MAIPTLKSVSFAQFVALTRPLIGMRVSRPWRGYGSAMFLELGALRRDRTFPTDEDPTDPRRYTIGEASIMIQWSWRIERARSIEAGSWSTDRRFERALDRLEGREILAIDVVGRLPELVIALSGGRWLHSFMTAEGQPEWAVRLPDERWLSVKRGVLVLDANERNK